MHVIASETVPLIGQFIPRFFMPLRPKHYQSSVSLFHVYSCNYLRNSTAHRSVHSTFSYVITSETVPLIGQFIPRLVMLLRPKQYRSSVSSFHV